MITSRVQAVRNGHPFRDNIMDWNQLAAIAQLPQTMVTETWVRKKISEIDQQDTPSSASAETGWSVVKARKSNSRWVGKVKVKAESKVKVKDYGLG